MITTVDLARELQTSQRNIQNRVKWLGLRPQKVAGIFFLTKAQAEKVRQWRDGRRSDKAASK